MNTRAWLHLNPTKHRVTLTAEPDGIVRAHFHGGEGVDQRFSGVGAQVEQACEKALEARAAIKSALP
jgi:hypothetical protein